MYFEFLSNSGKHLYFFYYSGKYQFLSFFVFNFSFISNSHSLQFLVELFLDALFWTNFPQTVKSVP